MRSCSLARAISSTGRGGPGSWCGGTSGSGAAESRHLPRVAFGRGRDGVLMRGSVTPHLPGIPQAPQQNLLADFVVGEVDLLEVECELQLGELGANLVLVIELGLNLLLDGTGQPQQRAARAEHRCGESA